MNDQQKFLNEHSPKFLAALLGREPGAHPPVSTEDNVKYAIKCAKILWNELIKEGAV